MRSIRHRSLLLGALATVAITAFVVNAWTTDPDTAWRPAASDHHGPSGPSGLAAAASRTLNTSGMLAPTKDAQHFSVSYQGMMTPVVGLQGAAAAVDLGPATTALNGRLEVTRHDSGDGWMVARMAEASSSANGVARRLVGDHDLAAALTRPWAFRVEPTGRVNDLKFSSGTALGAQSVAAAMTYGMQFAAAPHAQSADRWAVDEVDANGPYTATYTGQGADGAYTKRWTLGPQDAERNEAAAMGATHQTTARYDFARSGRLVRLSFQQSGAFAMTLSGTPARTAPFETKLVLDHTGQGGAGWAADVVLAEMVPFGTRLASARAHKAVSARDERTPAQLVAAASGMGTQMHRRGEVREAMTAALRSDRGLAGRFAVQLADGVHNEAGSRTIIEALAAAATPESERALVSLIGAESTSPNLRGRLLVAATLMAQPSAQFVSAITRLMAQARTGEQASLFAVTLGGAANTLGGTEPQRAGAIVERLVADATPRLSGPVELPATAHRGRGSEPGGRDRPASMEERQRWVAALGNTASPAARDAILTALNDPAQPVRVSAAYALRFQDPASTLTRMAQHLAQEPSGAVREALVSAAREMGPAAIPLVKKALFSDPNESVRLEAAYAVAVWSMKASGMRQVLGAALAAETSPVVRESLKNYMQPGRVAAPFRTAEVAEEEAP